MSSFANDAPLLLDEFGTLETELHQHETRRNRKRMEALLYPDFIEFRAIWKALLWAYILKEFGSDWAKAMPLVKGPSLKGFALRSVRMNFQPAIEWSY